MSNTTDLSGYLDALLGLPTLEYPIASPDGRWVAWTWSGLSATSDVYAVATDGSSPVVRLTATEQNVWAMSWSPDSKSVVVAQDENGNERAQLFRVDVAQPGVMQPLTEAEPNYYVRGGQLHPNGRWLVYGANVDEDGNEIESTWIYRHDLTTGQRTALAQPRGASWYSPQLSPTGTHVAYCRQDLHPAGLQLWLVGIDGANDREIVNVGADKKVSAVWTPDGQHLLIHAEAETHFRVGLWSLADETLTWLVDDPTRNIEDAYFPRNSERAVLLDVQRTRILPSLLDIHSGEETALPHGAQTLIPIAPIGDSVWSALAYSSTQVEDIVRWDVATGATTSLTHVWERTTLRPNDLTPAEDFTWRGDDGLEIQGWLYRARGAARGTIVFVHGGPTWHYDDRIITDIQFFAASGFHVLAPNYRGSTGFGRAYQESIKVDGWGGAEQDDIRVGIEALIAAGIAEPGKVGITGTSYGGYSSWWAITHWPTDIVAASSPICGMTDLVVDYETTRPDLRPYSAEMMGGTPSEVPERFRDRSPIHYVQNIRGKLQIVQGEQDPNVTPENVRTVREALDTAGVPYELLTFADEGHGIARRPNQRTLLLRQVTFFNDAFGNAGA
jgi:dipeptidyl aminopeptidase/acylaminoacyl peptidase